MSHCSLIKGLLTTMTVARYIYNDISGCTIGAMIGKWCVPIRIGVLFIFIYFCFVLDRGTALSQKKLKG